MSLDPTIETMTSIFWLDHLSVPLNESLLVYQSLS